MLKGWIRIRIRINRQGIATGLELAAVFYTARICPMIWGLLKAFFSSIFFVRWRLLRFLLDPLMYQSSIGSTVLHSRCRLKHITRMILAMFIRLLSMLLMLSVLSMLLMLSMLSYTHNENYKRLLSTAYIRILRCTVISVF